ncbi:DUF1828 domain-containing protein [Ligilactobacillus apodemi]|uniref:DUF1828 domain-containing protein n=1 Tax=Ligilactobacillus apodemi TaxID=307126 RepID=UPI00214CD7A4|nr:DUF1828 domain-containing protein [Ligilactobacillus apodemi]MCR1900888.1 DUF1828 domain-containing protein [Ligilactobacillus apodemi]
MTEENYTVITTEAIDTLHDNIELVKYGDTLTDDGYTHYNAFEENWNNEIISELVGEYGCELRREEIVCDVFNNNLERSITSMIQAITAVETYLYLVQKLEKGA